MTCQVFLWRTKFFLMNDESLKRNSIFSQQPKSWASSILRIWSKNWVRRRSTSPSWLSRRRWTMWTRHSPIYWPTSWKEGEEPGEGRAESGKRPLQKGENYADKISRNCGNNVWRMGNYSRIPNSLRMICHSTSVKIRPSVSNGKEPQNCPKIQSYSRKVLRGSISIR